MNMRARAAIAAATAAVHEKPKEANGEEKKAKTKHESLLVVRFLSSLHPY